LLRCRRWAIYIDIEGSSRIYARDEAQFFASVNVLLDGICRIGSQVCPETPNRLFVHQTGGDGFVIVSEFAQRSPEMPIAVAVVLMQTVLASGGVAKSGIAQGEFGDVQSCLPTLQDYPPDEHGQRRLGRGILKVFPIMGSALINAHRLAAQRPRGARLAVDRSMINQMPSRLVVSHESADLVVVDWIHTALDEIEEISSRAGIQLLPLLSAFPAGPSRGLGPEKPLSLHPRPS
jgi:hypothetical protein